MSKRQITVTFTLVVDEQDWTSEYPDSKGLVVEDIVAYFQANEIKAYFQSTGPEVFVFGPLAKVENVTVRVAKNARRA